MSQRTERAVARAIEEYRTALQLDPNFTAALGSPEAVQSLKTQGIQKTEAATRLRLFGAEAVRVNGVPDAPGGPFASVTMSYRGRRRFELRCHTEVVVTFGVKE